MTNFIAEKSAGLQRQMGEGPFGFSFLVGGTVRDKLQGLNPPASLGRASSEFRIYCKLLWCTVFEL